jgi:hypothetical protein
MRREPGPCGLYPDRQLKTVAQRHMGMLRRIMQALVKRANNGPGLTGRHNPSIVMGAGFRLEAGLPTV